MPKRVDVPSPEQKPTCVEVRDGEPTRTWFRSGRVFRNDGHYYIATREGIDVGPYDTPQEAEADLPRLIELLSEIDDPLRARLTIQEFRDRPKGASTLMFKH